MSRRTPYSKLEKKNQNRPTHINGNPLYRQFQCLDSNCTNILYIPDKDITNNFDISCPSCGFHHKSGEDTKLFDYQMVVNQTEDEIKEKEEEIVSIGEFSIFHDDYIQRAKLSKYCLLCYTLQPIENFDIHRSRPSGRQGECNLCKKHYNAIKNGTRTTDQHRESSQKRRLLLDIAKNQINSSDVYQRFNHRCFKCTTDLSRVTSAIEKPLDHTLPIYYLWPLTTENATLLCQKCNGEKAQKWPSEFYDDEDLKDLTELTNIPIKVLTGAPFYNPTALEHLEDQEVIDNLFTKYTRYIDTTIIPLRNRILNDTEFDFFTSSQNVPEDIITRANELRV